jgi:hypothetical protein
MAGFFLGRCRYIDLPRKLSGPGHAELRSTVLQASTKIAGLDWTLASAISAKPSAESSNSVLQFIRPKA